jgi:cytochrome b561
MMVGLFQEGILQPSNLIGALEVIGAVVLGIVVIRLLWKLGSTWEKAGLPAHPNKRSVTLQFG